VLPPIVGSRTSWPPAASDSAFAIRRGQRQSPSRVRPGRVAASTGDRASIGVRGARRRIRLGLDHDVSLLADVGDDAVELLRGIDGLHEAHVDLRAGGAGNDRPPCPPTPPPASIRVDVDGRLIVAQLEPFRGVLSASEAVGLHQRRLDVRDLVDRLALAGSQRHDIVVEAVDGDAAVALLHRREQAGQVERGIRRPSCR